MTRKPALAIALALATYSGAVSADGRSIAGVFTNVGSSTVVGTWQVTRGEPEPETVALLAAALAVSRLPRRTGRRG